MVYFEVAGDVLEDCGIARGVGDGEVSHARLTIGEHRRDDRKWFLLEGGHRLGDRRVGVEYILRPSTDRQVGPTSQTFAVVALRQIEQVGHKTLFVQAADCRDAVEAHADRAMRRRPLKTLRPGVPQPLHAPGEDPELRTGILHPVHRPTDHHGAVGKHVEAAGAGGGRQRREQRRQHCGHEGQTEPPEDKQNDGVSHEKSW